MVFLGGVSSKMSEMDVVSPCIRQNKFMAAVRHGVTKHQRKEK